MNHFSTNNRSGDHSPMERTLYGISRVAAFYNHALIFSDFTGRIENTGAYSYHYRSGFNHKDIKPNMSFVCIFNHYNTNQKLTSSHMIACYRTERTIQVFDPNGNFNKGGIYNYFDIETLMKTYLNFNFPGFPIMFYKGDAIPCPIKTNQCTITSMTFAVFRPRSSSFNNCINSVKAVLHSR